MGFERDYKIDFPAIHVPESRTFAYRTHLGNWGSVETECVLMRERALDPYTLRVSVREGESSTCAETRRTPESPVDRAKHEIKRRLHARAPVVDVGGDYALETRFNFLDNYAHLVHDLLGPLCQVRRLLANDTEAPDAVLRVILPKKAPALAIRTLDALEIPYVCTDGRVRGRVIEASSDQNLSMLKRIADLPIATLSDELPRKVFVSRRGKRTITNESEVWPFLEARGYARFFMEELTLEDQWSLLGRAEHVVGIHGAGLSNLAFCLHANEARTPRFRLVELHSAGYANNCFRLYAAILGGHWTGVRGRLESAIVRDLDEKEDLFAHQMASFEVDLTALEEALDFSARAEFAPANSRARAEAD